MKIGFIGTGVMGNAISVNLLKAGYEMGGTAQQGYHRNPVFLRIARVGAGDPEDQSGL